VPVKLGVVINPTAGHGRGRRAGQMVMDQLRHRGHTVTNLSGPDLESASAHARRAAVGGIDALVVVGGDGMVHLGVNVIAQTGLPLGVVSVGTGNDLSRALGLPRGNIAAAIRAIENGLTNGPRLLDAMRIGAPGHSAREWAIGAVSCGLDAAVNATANRMTWPRGGARYARAVLQEIRTLRPYGYRVSIDGTVAWESSGSIVTIANTAMIGGGVRVAPDARPDDGLLDVVMAGAFTRSGALGIFPTMYLGRHITHPAITVMRGTSVLVEHVPELGAFPPITHADGEAMGPVPVQVDVEPGAVGVLV